MKRTVELDTINIADRLDTLSRKAAAIAVAMIGVKESRAPLAISGLCDLAWDISAEARSISAAVVPNGGAKREHAKAEPA
jgi:hypothetical protein